MRTLKLWYYEPAQIVVVHFLARKESNLFESTHAVLFSQICGLQVIQCCKIIFIRISLNNSQMSLRFGSSSKELERVCERFQVQFKMDKIFTYQKWKLNSSKKKKTRYIGNLCKKKRQ